MIKGVQVQRPMVWAAKGRFYPDLPAQLCIGLFGLGADSLQITSERIRASKEKLNTFSLVIDPRAKGPPFKEDTVSLFDHNASYLEGRSFDVPRGRIVLALAAVAWLPIVVIGASLI